MGIGRVFQSRSRSLQAKVGGEIVEWFGGCNIRLLPARVLEIEAVPFNSLEVSTASEQLPRNFFCRSL